MTQQQAQIAEAGRWKRRVELHHHVHQPAGASEPGLGAVVPRRVLDRLVDPCAGLAPRHAHEAAVVQALQKVRADVQVATPAPDAAMVEMRLHVPGSRGATLAHELQHVPGTRLHPGAPRPPLSARMEQSKIPAREKTIVDEEGLFDRQARVAALELAGAIALDAIREDQVLRTCGRSHRVGLNEAQARDGPGQAGGLEEAARDCVAAKLLEAGGFARTHARQSTPAEGWRKRESAGGAPRGAEDRRRGARESVERGRTRASGA